MKIAYRRMSGAIGTSHLEQGTRGMWWEKRLALVAWLRARGHTLHYVNRMTKYSAQPRTYAFDDTYDVLMIEFGSANQQFYGEDLAGTLGMAARHKGRIIFINDDPDLPYLWKSVPIERQKRWVCWYNATQPQPFGGQPAHLPMRDFPFGALVPMQAPRDASDDALVYIGRPQGREKQVDALVAAQAPVRWYAKPKEYARWPQIQVQAPPQQPQRAAFYSRQLACLALADAKHKRMGWRTGRAYHAVAAGCPALSSLDHPGINWALHYAEPRELIAMRNRLLDKSYRAAVLTEQRKEITAEISLAERAAQAEGL